MANSHHTDPCVCTEAFTVRLTGFPFNRSMDIRSLV